MDYFNHKEQWMSHGLLTLFTLSILSVVSKGLMDSKVCCPMDCFNTVFSHVCPSFFFVPKWLMDSKGCQMDSF